MSILGVVFSERTEEQRLVLGDGDFHPTRGTAVHETHTTSQPVLRLARGIAGTPFQTDETSMMVSLSHAPPEQPMLLNRIVLRNLVFGGFFLRCYIRIVIAENSQPAFFDNLHPGWNMRVCGQRWIMTALHGMPASTSFVLRPELFVPTSIGNNVSAVLSTTLFEKASSCISASTPSAYTRSILSEDALAGMPCNHIEITGPHLLPRINSPERTTLQTHRLDRLAVLWNSE